MKLLKVGHDATFLEDIQDNGVDIVVVNAGKLGGLEREDDFRWWEWRPADFRTKA